MIKYYLPSYIHLNQFRFFGFDNTGLYLYTNGETLGSLKIWDLERKKEVGEYQINKYCDIKSIVGNDRVLAYRDNENYLRVFDTVNEIELYKTGQGKDLGTEDNFTLVNPDLLIYVYEGKISMIDISTKKIKYTLDFIPGHTVQFNIKKELILNKKKYESPFTLYNFQGEKIKEIKRQDLSYITTIEETSSNYKLKDLDGKVIDTIDSNTLVGVQEGLIFSPNDEYILSSYWNELSIYSLDGGLIDKINTPYVIKTVDMSPDSLKIFTTSYTNELNIIGFNEGKLTLEEEVILKDASALSSNQNPKCIFSPDSKKIYIAYKNGKIFNYSL